MKILVTGGAGFIGSNFIHYMLRKYPSYQITNIDLLTYAGNLENLKEVKSNPNYTFVKGDISHDPFVQSVVKQGYDVIINFAAESHVDRSIQQPEQFVTTNVMGTQILLNAAKSFSVPKFIQISTDEVYGSLEMEGYFTEQTSLQPNSPYSASKAGADFLVRAYHETFGLNVNITRCSNNYGPYQFPEKLIPLIITNALEDKEIPIYGDGMNVRDWLHVEDHCRGIDLILHYGKNGEVYNIGGRNERTNIEVVNQVIQMLGKSKSLITYVKDRLGHDRRYAIDATKIETELGWKATYTFEQGLEETVKWYLDHPAWWQNIKKGEYQKYYQSQYKERTEAK